MANNDFFEEQNNEAEPEKLKIGDQEFSLDEVQELIGAGRKLKEIEEKQGQPVDEILNSWGKRGNVIGTLEKEKEDLTKELDKYKNPPTKEEVDQETMRKQVLEELKGFGIPTIEDVKKVVAEIYHTNRDGERLLSQVKRVAREAKSDGKPEVLPEKLLEFMADPNNPKDPEKAYKLMFEKELEDWKLKRLNKAKGTKIMTETKTTAGAKEFTPKRPGSREELRSSLTGALYGEAGQ